LFSSAIFITSLPTSRLLQATLIGFLVFLALLPFVYSCGAGEADSGSMVAGIYQAALADGTVLTNPHYYFHTGQPLYNIVFTTLVRLMGISFDTLLFLLNHLAAFSTAVTAACLFYLARQSGMAMVPALIGLLVYVTAPFTFELGTYAHPQTLSISLIMLAFCFSLAGASLFGGNRRKSIILIFVSIMCGFVGLIVRMDGLVLTPLLLGVLILSGYSWRKFAIFAIGLPGSILLLAQGFRIIAIPDLNRPENEGLLHSLLRFMETKISDGLPSIMSTVGTGGIVIIVLGVIYAIIRGDKRGLLAAAVAIIPLIVYTTQNAHVPRRFIHLFIVAGFGACALYRAHGTPRETDLAEKSKNRVYRSRRSKADRTGAAMSLTAPEKAWFRDKAFLVVTLIIITGNWILWPAFAATAKIAGDQLPDTKFWKSVSSFIPTRHAEQQAYYCWTKNAYNNLIPKLNTPHDIIGGWLEYGELLSAFSRAGIQVSKKQIPLDKGRPTLTALTAGGITHYQYGPPWDYPPGQQTSSVVMLNNYGRDVTYGLKNISIVAPPPDIKYRIY